MLRASPNFRSTHLTLTCKNPHHRQGCTLSVFMPVLHCRLFKYNASGSTLERTFKFGINAQADAGVPINTIDQLEYRRT